MDFEDDYFKQTGAVTAETTRPDLSNAPGIDPGINNGDPGDRVIRRRILDDDEVERTRREKRRRDAEQRRREIERLKVRRLPNITVDEIPEPAPAPAPSVTPLQQAVENLPESKPETFPNDLNVNLTINKPRVERDTHLDDKKVRYQISKHVDTNRDLYFVKVVSGALKRKSFHSLIVVESENATPRDPTFDVKIKYTYTDQLLFAWAAAIEKVKNMISRNVLMTDRTWASTESIHRRLINNDTTLVVFARYVAFILMTETNNLVPRNKTRFVISDEQKIADERVLSVMRALHDEYNVLREDLASAYL